jgi:uncharacterized membrane protein
MPDFTRHDPIMMDRKRWRVIRIWRALLWGFDHWLLIFLVAFGVVNLLPFLAPLMMHIGWEAPSRLIYTAYTPLCHQMAQRSFFLFGQQSMYNLAELPVVLAENTRVDMAALRAFLGSSILGWKVAWSDRMVYMYGAVLLAGIAYAVLRQRRPVRPLGLVTFALLLIPIVIDGTTHMISDTSSGLAAGFRYDNRWLADLTGHRLPSWFYVGDRFGSFNSWMRLLSGLAFGFGSVWLAFPYVDRSVLETAAELRMKLARVQHSPSVVADKDLTL